MIICSVNVLDGLYFLECITPQTVLSSTQAARGGLHGMPAAVAAMRSFNTENSFHRN